MARLHCTTPALSLIALGLSACPLKTGGESHVLPPASPMPSVQVESSRKISIALDTEGQTKPVAYRIERAAYGTEDWTTVASPSVDELEWYRGWGLTKYYDTGVQPSTRYRYRVFAISSAGESDPFVSHDLDRYETPADPGPLWRSVPLVAGGLPSDVEGPGGQLAFDPQGHLHACAMSGQEGSELVDLTHVLHVEWDGATVVVEELANEARGVEGYCSLAFDSAGRTHLVTAGPFSTFVHFFWDGAVWQRESVYTGNPNGSVKQHRVAIDGADRVHVVFNAVSSLGYAVRDVATSTWTTEKIADTFNDFDRVGFRLDGAGTPHAAWSQDGLRYATRTAGAWVAEQVVADATSGQGPDLVLDDDGKPHLAFFDWKKKEVRYAFKSGSSTWTFETVPGLKQGTQVIAWRKGVGPAIASSDGWAQRGTDGAWKVDPAASVGTFGKDLSMAFDSSGRAFVSYYDEKPPLADLAGGTGTFKAAMDLVLAVREPGQTDFQRESPDTIDSTGIDPAAAVDPSGVLHVAYQERFEGGLRYGRLDAKTFRRATLDHGIGGRLDIAAAATDDVHIAQGGLGARYYHVGPAGFTAELVRVDGADLSTRGDAALALDSQRKPVLALGSPVRGWVLARKGAAGWELEAIDAGRKGCDALALAVDGAGAEHALCGQSADGTLWYAVRDGAAFAVTQVPTAVPVAGRVALAVDGAHRPVAAFGTSAVDPYQQPVGDLVVATRQSDGWHLELADPFGLAGSEPSVALDRNDVVHVLSWDRLRRTLRHLTRVGGVWQSRPVGAPLEATAPGADLALDGAGGVHLLYGKLSTDGQNRGEVDDLRYAHLP